MPPTLMTLGQFLHRRQTREPGVRGYLDECEELEAVLMTYEEWSQAERSMALTAPQDDDDDDRPDTRLH